MTDIRYRASDQVTRELVDMRDGTHEPRVVAHPPFALLTDGGNGPSARLRVDVGQTGFFAGREFRAYYEIAVAAADTVNLRFVSPINFILWEQIVSLDSGGRRIRVFTGATPTGTWTPRPTIGRNRMTDRPSPYYTPVCELSVGGTFTGGTEVELIRIRTTTNQGNVSSSTVGARAADERGLPPGTYIISMEPLTGVTDAAAGVYVIEWEERP